MNIKIDDKENNNKIENYCLYKKKENFIYFGSYPQEKVTDINLINLLTSKISNLPTNENNFDWTSYDYYIHRKKEKYMWYIDIEYDNQKYRGIYFEMYRPHYTAVGNNFGVLDQKNNEYLKNTIYWFKFQPIAWTIKEELNGNAVLVCDKIIDSQDFNYTDSCQVINGKTIYANNYEYSRIRQWLNDTFYNTAFNKSEQNMILNTVIDNSASSTKDLKNIYACLDTNDKIYLLSSKEALSYFDSNIARQKEGTDYAKSQGLWVYIYAHWWLRSPFSRYNGSSLSIDFGGVVRNNYTVEDISTGIVPALRIKL